MLAKATGISVAAGGMRALRAISVATGMVITRAAMLFMNADSSIATPSSANSRTVKLAREGIATWAIADAAPESSIARPITRIAATARTAGSAKPANAFAGATSPVARHASNAIKATRS